MRLKDIDFKKIQNDLLEAKKQADIIRKSLKSPKLSVKSKKFYSYIFNRLNKLNFKIIFTNKIINVSNYGHLPSLTIFKEQHNKKGGGCIYIYDKYSVSRKRELLLREFVCIHDEFKPIWTTDNNDLNNGYILKKTVMEAIELRTELVTLELMMPTEEFQTDLFHYSYDINKIIKIYKTVIPSTIIKWIMMHDYFNAHYALIFFIKNKEKEFKLIIDEYCRDINTFDIMNILLNENSIAFKTRKEKEAKSGVSIIENKNYQCFCFYEKAVQQPLPLSVSREEEVLSCDEMTVIGWSKEVFDIIKELEFKKKKKK